VAASGGQFLIVKFLVGLGADVNARNKAGSTPLHKAMLSTTKGIVEFLLQNKAEWVKNNSGFTPYTYARDILRDNKPLFYQVLAKETNKIAKETIKIPASALPIIIGKQGKMLETLRAQTQTDVEVPSKHKGPNEILPDEMVEVQLTARCQEDIEMAKKRIDELIKRQEEDGTKEKAEEFFKPKKEVKKKPDQPQSNEPKDKNYMKNIVTPIINPVEKPKQGLEMKERRVKVPKDKHGLIIGKKGANIENIKKTYGVSIIIPPESDPSELIVLQGISKEKLDEAKFEILKFVQGGRGRGGGGGGGGRGRMGGSSGGYRRDRDPQPEEPPKPSKPTPKPPQKINLNDANEWPAFN
jgi:transcription antitermination factor NusA-like protein